MRISPAQEEIKKIETARAANMASINARKNLHFRWWNRALLKTFNAHTAHLCISPHTLALTDPAPAPPVAPSIAPPSSETPSAIAPESAAGEGAPGQALSMADTHSNGVAAGEAGDLVVGDGIAGAAGLAGDAAISALPADGAHGNPETGDSVVAGFAADTHAAPMAI